MYASLLAGLLGMAALGNKYFHSRQFGRAHALDVATYWLDPFLCQLICMVLVAWLLVRFWLMRSVPGRRPSLWIQALCLVMIVFVVEIVLETLVLKPTFHYARPPNPLGEPWLASAVRHVQAAFMGRSGNSTGSNETSCPSGYALRQFWYLLLTFSCLRLRRPPTEQSVEEMCPAETVQVEPMVPLAGQNAWALALLLALSAFVLFSRVYRREHTLFDIGVTMGVASYSYWLVYSVVAVVVHGTSHKVVLTDMGAASLLFLPIFFFYSGSAIWSVAGILVILGILGITAYIVPDEDQHTSALGGRPAC
jgi:hypothetical protein